MYYQFHHIRIVEPRIIEILTRTLQVFIAILGTCDPNLKDLYTWFEPVTISGELPELSPSIAVYQFRQYRSFLYLERESNPHHRYVKTRRYHYIIKAVSMWITFSCRAIDNLFLHLFPQMVTIHPSHFKRVLPTPVCYRGVFKSLRFHRLLYLNCRIRGRVRTCVLLFPKQAR